MNLICTIFVIKHELRTDVEPESETALISAPVCTKYLTIGSFDKTAAHHNGVTWWTVESSGFSKSPRCSMSAVHSLIRNSAISKLPRLHTTNNGAQPSRILDTTYLRESRGKLIWIVEWSRVREQKGKQKAFCNFKSNRFQCVSNIVSF